VTGHPPEFKKGKNLAEDDGSTRYCFGCGDLNPQGLHLSFRIEGRRAIAEFTPSPVHQGWPGVVHGGLVAALLDEAMGWALVAVDAWAVTAKLELRLRHPLAVGTPVQVSAQVANDRGRTLELRGEIRDGEGRLLAEAEAVFVRAPQEREQELRAFYGLEG